MPTCARSFHCCGTISGHDDGGLAGRGITVLYLPPVVCSGGSGAATTVTCARPRSVSTAVIPSRAPARTRSGSAPTSGRSRTDSLVGAVWTIWNSSTPGVRSTTVPKASGGTVTTPRPPAGGKVITSEARPCTRIAGAGSPHGHGSGLTRTRSPTS